MGRAPCCDKANVKKGPWSPEEDAKLKSYIDENGTGGNWIALPQKIGIKRCGKSCRLRWLNYLRPNIKHGGFSEEEENIICSLYISIGSRWSIIAAQLPGRTDNDIKNYWNTRLKKKLLGKQRKEQHHARRGTAGSSSSSSQVKKKGRGNNSISTLLSSDMIDINVQTPYWPELSTVMPPAVVLPYPTNSYEPPSFNDHNSIRKLLIKLGGRFSRDDDSVNIQSISTAGMILNRSHEFPIEVSSIINDDDKAPPYHEPSTNTTVSASSLSNSQYSMDGQVIFNPVPILGTGESTSNNILTADQLVEIVYNANVNLINPQRIHGNAGMEFLYEDLASVHRSTIGITRGDDRNMDWGEMSSIFCPNPAVSCSYYEALDQQGIVQECGYTELNNRGANDSISEELISGVN